MFTTTEAHGYARFRVLVFKVIITHRENTENFKWSWVRAHETTARDHNRPQLVARKQQCLDWTGNNFLRKNPKYYHPCSIRQTGLYAWRERGALKETKLASRLKLPLLESDNTMRKEPHNDDRHLPTINQVITRTVSADVWVKAQKETRRDRVILRVNTTLILRNQA